MLHHKHVYSSYDQKMRAGTLNGRQEWGKGKPGLMKTTLTKKGKKQMYVESKCQAIHT